MSALTPQELAVHAYYYPEEVKSPWIEITQERFWEMFNSCPIAAQAGLWFLHGKTQSRTPEPENESLYFGCKCVEEVYQDRFYMRLMTIHDFFRLKQNAG